MVLSELPNGDHLSSSLASVINCLCRDTGSFVRHDCRQVPAEAAASTAYLLLQLHAPCLHTGLECTCSASTCNPVHPACRQASAGHYRGLRDGPVCSAWGAGKRWRQALAHAEFNSEQQAVWSLSQGNAIVRPCKGTAAMLA